MGDTIINSIEDEIETHGNTNEKEVTAIFEWTRLEIDKITPFVNWKKQKIIKETALKLEGKIPTGTIAMEILKRLHGIVSERLIRNCLDEKYKVKYRSDNAKKQKKKNNDLAAKKPLSREMKPNMVHDTHWNTLNDDSNYNSNSNSVDDKPACPNCQLRESKISGLEDALRKATGKSSADTILPKKNFYVFKEHKPMITNALLKCNKCCYLLFNANNVLEGVIPDVFQPHHDQTSLTDDDTLRRTQESNSGVILADE
jgi:hypothetical protein